MKIFYLNFNDDISINTFEKKISKINKIDFLINNAGINILDSIYNIKKRSF